MSQEAKLFYAARATRGHRFSEVSTTPGGRGLLLLGLFSAKEPLKWFGWYEVVSGRLVSPKNWDCMLEISGPILERPGLISD